MLNQKLGLRVLENACTCVALHTDFKPLCGLQKRQSTSVLQKPQAAYMSYCAIDDHTKVLSFARNRKKIKCARLAQLSHFKANMR
jgi:hypothetical protein